MYVNMRAYFHRKVRGVSMHEIIDDHIPVTVQERRLPEEPENNPFVSTGALTVALAMLTDPRTTPSFPLEP